MQVQLNKDQEDAVTHSGTPLLVAAGPGSGKTKVIVERIRHLIENGLKPSDILCLTFSEKAALEMRERLEKISDITDMQISTFHSFCNDVLADNVLDSGIGIGSGVINRSSLLVWALKHIDTFGFEHIELGNNAVNVIEAMVDGISTFKDELITPDELADYLDKKLNGSKKLVEDVIQIDYLQKLCDLHKLYVKHQEYLRKSRLIDFDDMVSLTIQLFHKKPNVLSKYQNQFKHVLVDEFQDNNYAQLELVKLLAPGGDITVVGDDDQSIYRFQGAYVANFEHFIKSYDNKVKIVILKQNYRSTKNIVKLASQLLANVPNRQVKELFSENEEGDKVSVVRCGHDMAEVEYVVSKIRSILGTKINRRDGSQESVSYRDFTILSRKRADGRKFAQALNAYGIPATFVGEANIFNSSTGRDLLAYLDITNNPTLAGLAINRVLKNSGISDTNIARINQEAKKRKNDSKTNSDYTFDVLTDLSVPEIDQLDELFDISKQLQQLTELQHQNTVSESVFKIMMKITDLYKSATQTDSLQDRKKQTILKELYHLSLEFESQNKNGTLGDFIDYLRLLGEFDVELEENAEISNAVRVSTIHQSKGKEFPIVFIVDVAQGKLPLRYQAKKFYVPNDLAKGLQREDDEKALALQEERRLFYVAMTRALISAMVDVIQPKPLQTICDPACGTGGFFLKAHDYIESHYNLDRDQKNFLKESTFKGWDIVSEVVRLCAMNLYLHGIGSNESPVTDVDALTSDPVDRFDIILTNPPFGRKSSITSVTDEGKAERETLVYERDDFWVSTSNKQLNFLQHVKTILKINGKCAIVVPDNVLFEGGTGETVRRKLLEQFDVHTLLRLPTGIFYAGGVKANVLFFDKKPARTDGMSWTEKLWIYDFRTNKHFTMKENTLKREDLDDFVKCFNSTNRQDRKETDRFKAFTYDDIIKRDKVSLDIFWLKDEGLEDTENLPPPDILAQEIADNLESALDSIKELITSLAKK